MKAVVDSNVIAYFLLGTEPQRAECEKFWQKAEETLAPAFWEAEITNVLWMAVRNRILDLPEALHRLALAKSLGVRSIAVSSLWHGALARSCASGIAAYDTLFVELAEREALQLATFDGQLLKTFPRIAKRPGALLRASAPG